MEQVYRSQWTNIDITLFSVNVKLLKNKKKQLQIKFKVFEVVNLYYIITFKNGLCDATDATHTMLAFNFS